MNTNALYSGVVHFRLFAVGGTKGFAIIKYLQYIRSVADNVCIIFWSAFINILSSFAVGGTNLFAIM